MKFNGYYFVKEIACGYLLDNGDFYAPVLELINRNAFQNSQFTSAYAPKLEYIGKGNGTLNTLLKK